MLYQVIDEAHTRYKFELWVITIDDSYFTCHIKPAFGQSLSRSLVEEAVGGTVSAFTQRKADPALIPVFWHPAQVIKHHFQRFFPSRWEYC
jgi:hypothetical protein